MPCKYLEFPQKKRNTKVIKCKYDNCKKSELYGILQASQTTTKKRQPKCNLKTGKKEPCASGDQ